MLWYKGWLETRWLLLLLTGPYAALLLLAARHQPSLRGNPPASHAAAILHSTDMTYFVVTLAVLLAGTGVNAQKSIFRSPVNAQGSTLFTLSLPVTRLRLLAVRAGLGWLETAGGIAVVCAGLWAEFEAIRAAVAPLEMLKYAAALVACATSVYALGVLLVALVKDRVLAWAGAIALLELLNYLRIPTSVDPRWAFDPVSRAVAFTMPWTSMGVSLGCAAVLLAATLQILRGREC